MENKKKILRIRVENKSQFYTLLKHMDQKGFTPHNSITFRYSERWPLITYEDNYFNGVDEDWLMDNRKYDTIDFTTFCDIVDGVTCEPEEVVFKSGNETYIVTANEVYVHRDSEQILYIADSVLEKIWANYKALSSLQ